MAPNTKLLKRKSALLANKLRIEYWDRYARNLISELLKPWHPDSDFIINKRKVK